MKINKVMLYNFNSYEGMNEFDFTSNDSSKNIAVVKGFRPHCLLIWKNRINEK